jgi:release factor glutamine methyltransferase
VTADPLVAELTRSLGSSREARWLLEELVGMEPAARRERATRLARRRAAGEPLQYVLGHWPFRTLDLLVDRRALIPRPETELLVGYALTALRARGRGALACDIGCGTGAIALSIAVETTAAGRAVEVLASDVSADALALARQNAARTGASAVSFHVGSWFDALPVDARGSIDVLCSNPPYVASAARPELA